MKRGRRDGRAERARDGRAERARDGRAERARDALAELEAQDAVFAALAHASRRHILVVLHARGGRVRAGDIASRFACAWPTTTRHLRVLEDAGLVSVEQEGRERYYVLQRERLQGVAADWLAHLV